MISIALCALALVVTWQLSRRSLVAGLAAVIAVGYAYGLVRAQLDQTFGHFIFDSAVLGFYFSEPWKAGTPYDRLRTAALRTWVTVLIAWPLLLLFVPIQDFLVQLVGFRGNVFLLPFLLVGARLAGPDLGRLAVYVAALNLAAFGFATFEFFYGIESLYPQNAMTEIIYRSRDLAGYTAHRIPATFTSAHAYAGSMVVTLPLLFGVWVQPRLRRWQLWLFAGAIGGSLLGVFMSGTRSHAIVLFLLILALAFSTQFRVFVWGRWVLVFAGVAWLVTGEERLQRFESLQDTEFISQRVLGSVNMRFVEILNEYPLGNGLGGGGTSIPYFLTDRLVRPVAMENEYARILLELGIPGLLLWVAFIGWALTRGYAGRGDPWFLSRRLALVACGAYFASGLVGVGLLTSIPQTCLLLLWTGWIGTRPTADPGEQLGAGRHPTRAQHGPVPDYARVS